jgi:hypothetical protein
MKQADVVKKAFETLVQTNVEAAVTYLTGADMPEDEARAEVAKVLASIQFAEKKEMLKDCLADVKLAFMDAIPDMDFDDAIAKLDVKIMYTKDEESGEGTWEVFDPRLLLVGEEKWMSTKRTSSGSGQGKSKVPMPEHLKEEFGNWKGLLVSRYPDHPVEGRSAPRELGRLKDEDYLAAEAASEATD